MAVQTFRDSIAWQRAMDLCVEIYTATETFPKDELFGLTSQLRRASVSIASNIAEGQGRLTTGEFAQFLGIARGSVQEVQTQLELASRLGLGEAPNLDHAYRTSIEVAKILNAVLTNLNKRKKEKPQ